MSITYCRVLTHDTAIPRMKCIQHTTVYCISSCVPEWLGSNYTDQYRRKRSLECGDR